MMKILSFLVVFITLPVFASDNSEAKKLLVKKAQELIKADTSIQEKKKLESFSINHPSFLSSPDIQTLKYHQTYVEKVGGIRREWDVLDGRLFVHYYPKSDAYELENELVDLKLNIDSAKILAVSDMLAELTKHLKAVDTLLEDNVTFQKKIYMERKSKEQVPVYFVKIKRSARHKVNATQALNTHVVNAYTGTVIEELSTLRKSHAETVEFNIYNGSENNIIPDEAEPKNSGTNKNHCQILSKETGDYVFVNLSKCSQDSDASTQRAEKLMDLIFNFYLKNFEYYGMLNDHSKKEKINVLVHSGKNIDNAFWDPDLKIMAFGDGTGGEKVGTSTVDYTNSIDISAHEYTHGIIDNTAVLSGPDEAGALNEGYADIMGVLIERSSGLKEKNWLVGEDLFFRKATTKKVLGLKSLEDPDVIKTSDYNKKGELVMVAHPTKVSKKLAQNQTCNEDNDYCEVHANSYIWSHCFYQITEKFKAEFSERSDTEIESALGKLYFLTLTHKIKDNETFKGAAQKTMSTCKKLMTAKECEIVEQELSTAELL